MNTPLVLRPPAAIARRLNPTPARARSDRPSLPATHRVAAGSAVQLGRRAGELTVLDGRAWVTCRGDLRDHVLEPGERMFLPQGHLAVVSPFDRGEDVVLSWRTSR